MNFSIQDSNCMHLRYIKIYHMPSAGIHLQVSDNETAVLSKIDSKI
jgi:hypothetical protein